MCVCVCGCVCVRVSVIVCVCACACVCVRETNKESAAAHSDVQADQSKVRKMRDHLPACGEVHFH